MEDLREHKKVIIEIQENVTDSVGSLTSLKQDLSEEQTTLSKDGRSTEMPGANQSIIDISFEEINCTLNKKATNRTADKNVQQGRKPKTVNTRIRSQKLIKTHSQRKHKLRTRRKEQLNMSENSDNEGASEDRFAESEEPEIEIHCRAKYIKLKPISKKDLEGKDLYIEVEIDKDLIVSPIEKYESPSGNKSKYAFKVSSRKESKKHGRTKFQSETLTVDHNASVKVKNKRKREEMSVKRRKPNKVEIESKNKKAKQIHSTQTLSKEYGSQPLEPEQGYDSDTDIEGDRNETSKKTTADANVTDPVFVKHHDDDIVSEEDKTCMTVKSENQEAKEIVKPKVRRKKATKPRPPKKESNKGKKETANTVDYTTRITEDGVKMFQCLICRHETRFLYNLKTHNRIHTGEKPYKCATCMRNFTDQATLQEHRLSHSEARTFRCHVCASSFKGKRDLQKHLERHSGNKRFLCFHCGSRFYKGYELRSHLKTHSVEKNKFPCSSCKKQFSSKSNLDRHLLIHSGLKAFQCEKCGLDFARKDYLKKHGFSHEKS